MVNTINKMYLSMSDFSSFMTVDKLKVTYNLHYVQLFIGRKDDSHWISLKHDWNALTSETLRYKEKQINTYDNII